MTSTMRNVDELVAALGIPFSDEQLAAITAPLEPAVIIAGAGSGKTTVMAARVVWLVGTGQVDPARVLGLTFTRKAAGELDARIRRALVKAKVASEADQNPLVATYDSFAARLVDDYGLLLGIEPNLRLLNNASRFRLASSVVSQAGEELQNLGSYTVTTVTNRVLGLSADMRSHLVSHDHLVRQGQDFAAMLDAAPPNRSGEEYARIKAARVVVDQRSELADLVVAYERRKTEQGYVEFADILADAARLAREVPEVSTQLRADFSVVMLDEYQDTSAAQAVLLRGLFSGSAPETGLGHPVTAVGDPGQAIYGWRGAASSNILQFSHEFRRADATASPSYPLTINRRSGPEILDAANRVAAELRAEPMVTATGLDLSLVAPANAEPARIETARFDTDAEELAWLAGRVAELHDSGDVEKYSEIAVLCRTNTQVAAVAGALSEAEIPAEVVGLGGLLELPVVDQVVATLTILADPTANAELLRVLTSSRWALGLPDLELLGRRARQLSVHGQAQDMANAAEQEAASLLEAVTNPGPLAYSSEARTRFAELTAELSGLRRYLNGGLNELVSRVIQTLNLAAETEVTRPGSFVVLHRFVAAVADYIDFDPQATLSGLLAYIAAERSESIGLEQPVISEADSVKVLTVHKAKGLEWDAVFLPGLRDQAFPLTTVRDNWVRAAHTLPYPLRGDVNALPVLSAASDADLKGFEQALGRQLRLSEDRLAYVAITRARRRLFASTAVWGNTNARCRNPSDYFAALVENANSRREPELISAVNPNLDDQRSFPWPVWEDEARMERRNTAAARVRRGLAEGGSPMPDAESKELDSDGRERLAGWDEIGQRLIAVEKADRDRGQMVGPEYFSVTGLASLAQDPEAFARSFRRPMPYVASDAQRMGTSFHRWLEERFQGQTPLVDDLDFPDLPGDEFEKLRAGFEAGPFADAQPVGVEVPFTLVLAGQLVRGRIDAVFRTADGRYQVVDWKTGSAARADPLQLACYRLAWAELMKVDPAAIDAMFFDLHRGASVVYDELPGRAEIEAVMSERLGTLPK